MNRNTRKLRDWADNPDRNKEARSVEKWGAFKERFPISFVKFTKLFKFRKRHEAKQ